MRLLPLLVAASCVIPDGKPCEPSLWYGPAGETYWGCDPAEGWVATPPTGSDADTDSDTDTDTDPHTGTAGGSGSAGSMCAVRGGVVTGVVYAGYYAAPTEGVEVFADAPGQVLQQTLTLSDGSYALDLPEADGWRLYAIGLDDTADTGRGSATWSSPHTGCCGYDQCYGTPPVPLCDSAVIDFAPYCVAVD